MEDRFHLWKSRPLPGGTSNDCAGRDGYGYGERSHMKAKNLTKKEVAKWMRTANPRFDGETPRAIAMAGGMSRVQFALEQLPVAADEVRQALVPYLKYAKGPTLEFVRQQIARSPGARKRELTARYLLLHQDKIGHASAEDIAALEEYYGAQRWKSMRRHDRGMYQLLSAGAEKYRRRRVRAATLVRRLSRILHNHRALVEQQLREFAVEVAREAGMSAAPFKKELLEKWQKRRSK